MSGEFYNQGSKFWKRILPPQVWTKIRNAFVFRPEDPNNLIQITAQMKVKTHVPVERIKGFRFPAPGSQPQPSVPTRESEDEVYDIRHFSKDPANLPNKNFSYVNSSNGPIFIGPEHVDKTKSSQGRFKNPAVATYDSTGLRSSMSATWKSLDEVIINCAPDHLPEPEWLGKMDEIIADAERKNIPITFGRPYKYAKSSNYNQVRW